LAQGFQVKPMQIDATVPPGRISETAIQLGNSTNEVLTLIVRGVELTQEQGGAWQMHETGAAETSPASATSWISLQAGSIELGPGQSGQVGVRIAVPADARGTYVAGIVAEQPAPTKTSGLNVRIRFLIPVIIQIAGRPVRQQVELSDLRLERAVATTGADTTVVGLSMVNKGRTFSKFRGDLRVDVKTDGKWRLVSRMPFAQRSIIPGVTLSLGSDMLRRLPSGTYRLRADMFVDGRRIKPMEKEIDFQGDPTADAVTFDTTLLLEPDMVKMDIVPGATRTTTVTITNPGDLPVEVNMIVDTPPSLKGVTLGAILGNKMSAAPWTVVRPAQFTLRPNGRQRVRVISMVPRGNVEFANYYADLILQGRYADGQSGGETHSRVWLRYGGVAVAANGVIDRLQLAEGDGASEYVVQSRFVNIGNVHIEPVLRAHLIDSAGLSRGEFDLTGEEGVLLPLGVRDFGGSLDFSQISEGDYALRVDGAAGGVTLTQKQIRLHVSLRETVGGDDAAVSQRVVTMLDDAIAADQPVAADAPPSPGHDQ
jgi:hypothetical protein